MIAVLKKTSDAAGVTLTHNFIKTLYQQKKLLRVYTQNIDGLERRAGLPTAWPDDAPAGSTSAPPLLAVMLHGDVHSLRCQLCAMTFGWTDSYLSDFLGGNPPACPDCDRRREDYLHPTL
jgi:NAD-dependent histone deacetylase SIR2